uniref:Putative NADPH reductase TAH18 n=1 Tax=Lygus hesperus TaxID=30085 RepID=A0A0A9WFK3_LYGHE
MRQNLLPGLSAHNTNSTLVSMSSRDMLFMIRRYDSTRNHVCVCMRYRSIKNIPLQLLKLAREHCVLVICSSTGNGDLPKNASKFVTIVNRVRELCDRAGREGQTLYASLLSNTHVSLLGLGDSTYDRYNAAIRVLSS